MSRNLPRSTSNERRGREESVKEGAGPGAGGDDDVGDGREGERRGVGGFRCGEEGARDGPVGGRVAVSLRGRGFFEGIDGAEHEFNALLLGQGEELGGE